MILTIGGFNLCYIIVFHNDYTRDVLTNGWSLINHNDCRDIVDIFITFFTVFDKIFIRSKIKHIIEKYVFTLLEFFK